jgi:hypothetical protein
MDVAECINWEETVTLVSCFEITLKELYEFQSIFKCEVELDLQPYIKFSG